MKGCNGWCLLEKKFVIKEARHHFATCHLGEVHGPALHSELMPTKCTLCDEQLPFPEVVQLEPDSQLLWAVNQILCTPEGSDQPQV